MTSITAASASSCDQVEAPTTVGLGKVMPLAEGSSTVEFGDGKYEITLEPADLDRVVALEADLDEQRPLDGRPRRKSVYVIGNTFRKNTIELVNQMAHRFQEQYGRDGTRALFSKPEPAAAPGGAAMMFWAGGPHHRDEPAPPSFPDGNWPSFVAPPPKRRVSVWQNERMDAAQAFLNRFCPQSDAFDEEGDHLGVLLGSDSAYAMKISNYERTLDHVDWILSFSSHCQGLWTRIANRAPGVPRSIVRDKHLMSDLWLQIAKPRQEMLGGKPYVAIHMAGLRRGASMEECIFRGDLADEPPLPDDLRIGDPWQWGPNGGNLEQQE